MLECLEGSYAENPLTIWNHAAGILAPLGNGEDTTDEARETQPNFCQFLVLCSRRPLATRSSQTSASARPECFDGTGQSFRMPRSSCVGRRIAAIESSSSGPVDVDLGQSTLLPRIDRRPRSHRLALRTERPLRTACPEPAQEVLYAAENAYLTLMAGVTTVQSPGQPSDLELRDAIARGVLPGTAHPDVDRPVRADHWNAGRAPSDSA